MLNILLTKTFSETETLKWKKIYIFGQTGSPRNGIRALRRHVADKWLIPWFQFYFFEEISETRQL